MGSDSSNSRMVVTTTLVAVLVLAFETKAGGVEQTDRAYPFCGAKLFWVPLVTKEPYITFLNDANCPTWTTKHFITKEAQNSEIILPRGLPFAFFCGVCYSPSNHHNRIFLSQSIGGGSPKLLTNAISLRNDEGKLEYRKNDHECQIVYGLTDYLEDPGHLSCTAMFGQRIMTETVTYSLVEPEVVEENESVVVQSLKQTVTLTCQGFQKAVSSGDPVTYVWFHPISGKAVLAAPTTTQTATFQLQSEPLIVACAEYPLYRAGKTLVTTFVVGTEEFVNGSPESLANGGARSNWGSSLSGAKRALSDGLLFTCTLVGCSFL